MILESKNIYTHDHIIWCKMQKKLKDVVSGITTKGPLLIALQESETFFL